ncbi:retrovirus-related pol polyprotein from transposon TNT 1-94 [Tanacetum coccineum]
MQNPSSPTPYVPPIKNDWDILFQPMIDEYFNPPQSVVSLVPAAAALRPADLISTPSSTSIDQDESSASEAVVTACYTQNRSLIRKRQNNTPYELLHDKKPDLTYFHVFGALCYPANGCEDLANGYEDLGKLKPKADSGIFVEYAPTKKACRIYNMQTRLIMETMHVEFDELTAMAF